MDAQDLKCTQLIALVQNILAGYDDWLSRCATPRKRSYVEQSREQFVTAVHRYFALLFR